MRQYRRRTVLAIWVAAAAPMALLAWVVAPSVGSPSSPRYPLTLFLVEIAGLLWQGVLALALVVWERRGAADLRVGDALWLRAPVDRAARPGGRLWWWLVPFLVAYGVLQVLPVEFPAPSGHSFGEFLGSDAAREELRGAWGLLALVVVGQLANTVVGEELLFRGLLLPRMRGAFGRADWVANGVLFGLYHVHMPWSIPGAVIAGLLFAYPTRRFRSAWMGIAIHSAQSVVVVAVVMALVIG
ncbi:CPBP family intramembrane glutamic endopeptidase [Micromonospora sp. CPCC 206061]|uniref:CPBP family intramembrane glutamic endopeptidase n=1 Tax=Micromonospora sp. CPCC 206061 TaxID=3122410 RepID=UPI002FF139EE